MSDGSTFRSISDNGKWAVAYGVDDASSSDAFPKLVNLSDKSVTELTAGLGVLSCLAAGGHTYLIGRTPSAKILLKAFAEL